MAAGSWRALSCQLAPKARDTRCLEVRTLQQIQHGGSATKGGGDIGQQEDLVRASLLDFPYLLQGTGLGM